MLLLSIHPCRQMLENKLPITGELFEKVLDIPLYSTMGNTWPSFYGESDLIFCGKGGKQDPEWKPEGILEKVGNDSLAQGENDAINGNRAAKGGTCVVGLARAVVGTEGGLESHHVHLHHLSLPASGLPIQLVEVSPVVN